MNVERRWYEGDKDDLLETIETTLPFFFRYKNNDYLIERLNDDGYIIVDPDRYYRNSPLFDPDNHTYAGHLQAKTAEEFIALQFLDGRTIFDAFDELRFFNY